MAGRWLILADDLTGAADCAIAFGRRGSDAGVSWGEPPETGAQPPVFSYDTDSRGMAPEVAARTHGEMLARLSATDRTLFKKIDSTLRGNPAVETAATIAFLKAQSGAAFGIFAPAFPATRRTTIGGRIHVNGRPLEEAEVWQRDHSYESANLVEVLATAGVKGEVVPLATVRGTPEGLKAALDAIAGQGDIVAVCDAESDDDLNRIAQASLPARPGTFFIGSAGLAHALAAASPDAGDAKPALSTSTQGALMVVGSLAAVSRAGARKLIAAGGITHVPVTTEVLLSLPEARAELGRTVTALLDSGQDVMVEIVMGEKPDMTLGPRLVEGLADALKPVAGHMSAFAATGGETAAALLSSFGVNGIRLIDEIEPGVALGLTLGALSVPVVTKAGAFGDEDSLSRIAARLRTIRKGASA
ncbi:Hrp-dependent type III effector protein [Azorhizobium oxalatiphilum]|uniref:Hrp-dependent type III effector protein n=1 Tax=Azorhizobium oxalatiphilum TaxID=980631 RepID=A0A917C443_9HYPH|nr:four-carbon acid sugar kinase family protein [Azorhizobium oxalatiphilum]GGF69060.1 Hrp-dependent type III effector protein [Azorhizobium oxalatiphilum]